MPELGRVHPSESSAKTVRSTLVRDAGAVKKRSGGHRGLGMTPRKLRRGGRSKRGY